MNDYIEIQILPDPEFATSTIMNALYSRLHQVLVDVGNGKVGVSFPDIDLETPCKLGNRIRLFGDANRLLRLMGENWTSGLNDHIKVSDVLKVPQSRKYRSYFRVQAKSNPERMRRRRRKRHAETDAESFRAIPESAATKLNLPFVTLDSKSTGHRFPLFISVGECVDEAISGEFNSYGLSRTANVPWF